MASSMDLTRGGALVQGLLAEGRQSVSSLTQDLEHAAHVTAQLTAKSNPDPDPNPDANPNPNPNPYPNPNPNQAQLTAKSSSRLRTGLDEVTLALAL